MKKKLEQVNDLPRDRETLEEVMAGLPNDGWRIALSEIVPGEGEKYLGHMTPTPDIMDVVGRKYGAGEYLWRMKRPDGRFPTLERDGVRSCGRFQLSVKEYPKKDGSAAAPAAASESRDDLFKMMMNQQQQFAQLMQTQQQGMLTMMTGIITSLVGRNGPDPVEQVARLHELSGGGRGGEGGSRIEELREIMGLARELGGEGGGGGGEGDTLSNIARIVESVGPMFAGQSAPPAPVDDVEDRPPRPALAPRPAVVESGPMNIVDKLKIVQMVRDLVVIADRGGNPGVYAAVFCDQVSGLNIPLPEVRSAMCDPAILDTLSARFPELVSRRAWFEEYLSAVREILGEVAPSSEKSEPVAAEVSQ